MSKITHIVSFELTPEQLEDAEKLIMKIMHNAENRIPSACIGQLFVHEDGTASAIFGLIPVDEFHGIQEILDVTPPVTLSDLKERDEALI